MKQKSVLFVILFFIISGFCAYGGLIKTAELSGVQSAGEEVACTASTLLDGSYQTFWESKWSNNFPGRELLIRTRSQILYSLFRTSSNSNVIIGKDQYLMEGAYIASELDHYVEASDAELDEMASKLSKLNNLLKENDKHLYIMISPSKAHFYDSKIPQKLTMFESRKEDQESYREYFVKKLDDSGLVYLDGTSYIYENKDKFKAPVFYKSGVHWTRVWGDFTAVEMMRRIEMDSGYKLNHYEIQEYISDEPIYPDTDLYDSLNMWKKAKDVWYEPNLIVKKDGKDKPNVFYRGCSFMGQSLSDIATTGCFDKVVHLENNYCYTENYSAISYMDGFTDYDQLPIDQLLGQSDILILEGNSSGLKGFSFGFVDYLLEHPEYLDSKY